MQKLPPVIIVILLFSLLFSECYDKSNTFTVQDAIAKYKSRYISDFPDKPGVWERIYRNIGGKPPGIQVPMFVEILIAPDGRNAYILTFNEKWDALDFHYSYQTKSTLSHQSKVKVTPDSITFLGESGDTEPDID